MRAEDSIALYMRRGVYFRLVRRMRPEWVGANGLGSSLQESTRWDTVPHSVIVFDRRGFGMCDCSEHV